MSIAALASQPTDRNGSLSFRWFGLDWEAELPWTMGRLRVEYGTYTDALPYMNRHFVEFFGFGQEERWLNEPLDANKREFLHDADYFSFRDDDDTVVGLAISHPTDWSSYYIRSMSLLPRYRSRGATPEFVQRLSEVLSRHGVRHLEADVCAHNTPSLVTSARIGFVPTGSLNTVRWGSLVRMTRFVDPTAASTFDMQYCAGTRPKCPTARSTSGQEGRPR